MSDLNFTFETFDVNDPDDLHLRWTKWITRLNRYFLHTKTTEEADKLNALLMFAGYDLEMIYNEKCTAEDNYAAVSKILEKHFNPTTSQHLNRYNFRSIIQREQESFDEFITRIKLAAKTCNFGGEEETITQIISSCQSDSLKKKALSKASLDLKELIELGRSDDVIKSQVKGFKDAKPVEINDTFSVNMTQHTQARHQQTSHTKSGSQHHRPHVHWFNNDNFMPNNHGQRQDHGSQNNMNQSCKYCGQTHPYGCCPARGTQCNFCGRKNHFESVCMQKSRRAQHQPSQQARTAMIQNSNYHQYYTNDELNQNWNAKSFVNKTSTLIKNCFMPTALLFMLHSFIVFSLDTGSQVDIMDEASFNKLKIKPRLERCGTTLFGYSCDSPIKTIGQFTTRVSHTGIYRSITFIVTAGNAGNLLSYKSAVELEVIQEIDSSFQKKIGLVNMPSEIELKWINKYPNLFTGKVGVYKNFEAKLYIDESVKLQHQKLRPVPFHLRSKVEGQLKDMIENDLIEPVIGPTKCVSPIVLVPKRYDTEEIRICTDARIANQSILRERHTMPTVDDLIVRMNGAKVISKFDLKCGYNQIVIEQSCRYITAFCTHLGIFQYKRLNFGINTAAEIFQKAIERVLIGLENVLNISDDIIVFGRTQLEHDEKLDLVLQRLESAGLTLNTKKCEFSKTSLDFFGVHFSDNGISIQESKISALINAPNPKNVSEIRSILGLVNYCSRFIDNLATIAKPLNDLTKKQAKFEWTSTQEEALKNLKNTLSTSALAYFDKNLRSEVTVDASPVGLGLVLAQYDPSDPVNTRSIVQYASRTLSDVESRYSQVEKEALAVVWACEKLHRVRNCHRQQGN